MISCAVQELFHIPFLLADLRLVRSGQEDKGIDAVAAEPSLMIFLENVWSSRVATSERMARQRSKADGGKGMGKKTTRQVTTPF